ncbi:MAG: hypothetical protein M1819_003537 [Sarea resinae]|nr:MAG: hypothetical protein M1819_003537 [Sarea resinae]
MSIFRSSSSTRRDQAPPPAQPSDQRIALIDATAPQPQTSRPTTDPEELSPALSNTSLAQKTTSSSAGKRRSLREELARRKYAKWQMTGKRNQGQGQGQGHETDSGIPSRSSSLPRSNDEDHPAVPENGEGNGAARQPRSAADAKQDPYEIDILYEHQRGWFFWGIPFYSHRSLLNFDPAAWVTAELKESPVDITNAQVPDPSWEWAWKSWYVDMSEDVDEQGWQYSFSFNSAFSWHGVHVRFNSWVRRRRWIRKRVRRRPAHLQRGQRDALHQMREGHMMNEDYFTIHSSREKLDRASTINNTTGQNAARSSYISRSSRTTEDDTSDDELLNDISTIGMLMKALKRARIDREKIGAVIKFTASAGEEIYYLAERMPEIMHALIFQSSRQHLLSHLQATYCAASSDPGDPNSNDPEDAAEKRRIDNLCRAVQAAEHEVRRLEYWSDFRRAGGGDSTAAGEDTDEGEECVEGGKGCDHKWVGLDGSGPEAGPEPQPDQDESDNDGGDGAVEDGKRDNEPGSEPEREPGPASEVESRRSNKEEEEEEEEKQNEKENESANKRKTEQETEPRPENERNVGDNASLAGVEADLDAKAP